MKKVFLCAALVFIFSGQAHAAKIFTTTINDTTVAEVREAAIFYMMDQNFAVDRVEDYSIVFTKGFGDGFWTTFRNMFILFNLIQKDGNVRLMVTQTEDSKYFTLFSGEATFKGQRNIDHLIPLIKDIRHSVDGTPLDQIMNESREDNGGEEDNSKPKYRDSGLSVNGNTVTQVERNSIAEKAGLKTGDIILEISARPAEGDLKRQIDQRLLAGRSVVLTYERNGNKDVLTLRQN